MEWYTIVIGVLGAVGGSAGLLSIYKAKPQKRAIEIENLIDTMNQEKKTADEYRVKSEVMIARLRERIELVEKRNKVYYNSIISAYRCRSVDDPDECPVLKTFSELCDKNNGVCEISQ